MGLQVEGGATFCGGHFQGGLGGFRGVEGSWERGLLELRLLEAKSDFEKLNRFALAPGVGRHLLQKRKSPRGTHRETQKHCQDFGVWSLQRGSREGDFRAFDRLSAALLGAWDPVSNLDKPGASCTQGPFSFCSATRQSAPHNRRAMVSKTEGRQRLSGHLWASSFRERQCLTESTSVTSGVISILTESYDALPDSRCRGRSLRWLSWGLQGLKLLLHAKLSLGQESDVKDVKEQFEPKPKFDTSGKMDRHHFRGSAGLSTPSP